MSDLDKFLAHHGIRGMKWGVRRRTGSDGLVVKTASSSSETSKSEGSSSSGHESADHERAVKALAKAKEKGTSSLSNDEIKAITNRVKAQKELHQLTTEQKSELQKKVDQLRLEKDYRQLSAEAALANRSTGRKIIDSVISSMTGAATKHVSEQGSKMVEDMLSQMGTKKSDLGGSKPTTSKKSSRPMPFKVNPSKVKVTPTGRHTLPDLLKNR